MSRRWQYSKVGRPEGAVLVNINKFQFASRLSRLPNRLFSRAARGACPRSGRTECAVLSRAMHN